MVRSRFLRDLLALAVLAAAYFGVGKLGLKLAFLNASATAVWPCTGIALAAFLIRGYRAWPAILAGAFLVNLTTAGSAATSLGIAVGNTLEGVVGCYLVSRFAGSHRAFERAQDVLKFAFLAGMVSTTVSATVGVTTLALAGFADWTRYSSIWSTWWVGDAVGALVVTLRAPVVGESPPALDPRADDGAHFLVRRTVPHRGDRLRRPLSRCREKLSLRIPLHSFFDLGGVPVWSP